MRRCGSSALALRRRRNPTRPQPNAVSARARRIQRLTEYHRITVPSLLRAPVCAVWSPSRAAPRTRLVRLHGEASVFIHAERSHGDLPERQGERGGDALRAKWARKVPKELGDLLAERYGHRLNSARRGSAASGSRVSARSQGQRRLTNFDTLYLEPLEWTMSTIISDEFTDCGRLLVASLRRYRRSRVVVRER